MTEKSSKSLSLRQIQLLHPRERLQVHPLLWTSRHLDLLGCPFVDAPPIIASLPRSSQDTCRDGVRIFASPKPSLHETHDPAGRRNASCRSRRPLSDLDSNIGTNQPNTKQHSALTLPPSPSLPEHARWAKVLAGSFKLSVKEAMVRALFLKRAVPTTPTSTSCVLHFETNRIRLRCLLLGANPTSVPSQKPTESSISYLDASSIRDARSKYLKESCQAWNSITRSLYNTRLSVLQRGQRAHDSYVTAILIAMAQHQCRSAPGKSIYRVHVLLSDVDNKSRMIIYTAEIPNSFLDKLAHPRRRPPPSAAFQVQARTIEYEPYATFQQRLSQALIPCGTKRVRDPDSDDGDHEHYVQKRRRADNG
ncbi:hypothetical protein K4K54_001886 [Colletotrichum sp. SAR 10_86]|nr:hypothetical protein KHU50_005259 [Colletotrichum sp. SAR 10_65]KAI8228903.1 hypothetical protein K4K54_001886 [Colletotrichum sp. SAR 10_86]